MKEIWNKKILNERTIALIAISSFLLFSILFVSIEPVKAAGDDFASATEIEVPGDFSGEITSENQEDYYTFYLEGNEKIEIEYTSQTQSDEGQRLRLYNPDGDYFIDLSSKDGFSDTGEYMLANETEPGYWFIRVDEGYGSGEGEYSFSVSLSSQDDGGSGGDVASGYSDAYEIEEGEYSGTLQDLDEMDMYKIYIDPGSQVEIEYTSQTQSDEGQRLRLYNPDGDYFIDLSSKDGFSDTGEYMLANETEPGYWFIRVDEGYGSGEGEYSFSVSTSPQNDAGSGGDVAPSFQNAYEIQEGTYQGTLQDLDEEDMYKIHIDPSSHVEIEFTSQAEGDDDQRLRLYNSNGDQVGEISSSHGSTKTLDYMLANETEANYWYIDIDRHYGGYEGNYSFSVSTSSQNDAGSGMDVASQPSDAYEIQEGTYQGTLQDLDEMDLYKIHLDPGANIEIEFTSQAEGDDDQRLRLFNLDGNNFMELSSSQGSSDTGSHSIAEENEAGYWYIGVDKHYGGYEGDYSFDVSVEEEVTEFDLTINTNGDGTTTPSTGTHTYEEGEEVTITANPDSGWGFSEWTGDYTGTEEEITITMDENKEITATFEEEITTVTKQLEIETVTEEENLMEGNDIEFRVIAEGETVEDATISNGENTATTGSNGIATLSFEEAGEYTVTTEKDTEIVDNSEITYEEDTVDISVKEPQGFPLLLALIALLAVVGIILVIIFFMRKK